MFTLAQKRRVGERDLWGMIVDNDDICFEHILPKLNQNDIKFLYDVNSETRALIKRSSRANDLKKRFRVSEMSSISTLEFAWNNVQWGTKDRYNGWAMTQAWLSYRLAQTNKLELLKWAREEKECEWSERTIQAAAEKGNLEMVKYCVENQCPIDTGACAMAAYSGQLECLKYLHEEAGAPWDGGAVREARRRNRPECLQYLLDNNCPLPEMEIYECSRCRISFASALALQNHMRLHRSLPPHPWSCILCNHRSQTKGNTVRHVARNHPEQARNPEGFVIYDP